MHRIVLSLALITLLMPLLAAPTQASPRGFAGAEFAVGGVYFSLGFSDFDRHHEGPRYYYETERRLAYRGYECTSACYIDDGRFYHHPECPILLHHFERAGFDPYTVWSALPEGGVIHYRHSYSPGYHDDDSDRRFDRRRGRRGHRRGGHGGHSGHGGHGGHSGHGGSDSDSDSDSDRR